MAKPLNIVAFIVDQHRHDMLGCAGFPRLETPHLDAFAAEGVRFSQAICNAPECVPSRHSFMSGLYPHETGIRSNKDFVVSGAPFESVGSVLQRAGYATAAIGKMHWKPLSQPPGATDAHKGFAYRAAFLAESEGEVENVYRKAIGEETFEAFINEFHAFDGPGGESAKGYIGAVSSIPAAAQQDGWLTKDACAFIERHEGDRPFLLVLSLDRPHPPSIVPPEFGGLYDPDKIPLPTPPPSGFIEEDAFIQKRSRAWSAMTERDTRTAIARYMENASYVDSLFGELIATLKSKGIYDDTAIFFFSDHGEMLGGRNKVFSKYCLYEDALRVPLIVRWPGMGPQGAVASALVELVDLFPTWLDIAGATSADSLAGRSLRPLLESPGREPIGWRDAAFAELHNPDQWALRTRSHKLIVRQDGKNALFDLQRDPNEFTNLYRDESLAALRQDLLDRLDRRSIERASRSPRAAG